ncbi:MAG: protein-L-isoaspartate(D-aspartate) O-methyltransferase [Bacteroidota bacterium]
MDNFRFRGLRKRLIDELRAQNRFDDKVLSVMENLPRHAFLDSSFAEWAYQDQAFQIACEQTISQPSTVALQTTLLNVLPRQKVLEVGTGSGYQAAVLSLLGGRVFTLERHDKLYAQAKLTLKKLRLSHIRCFLRDGFLGLPEMAPFDRIIVTAGAEELPMDLLHQLKVGGIAVIPLGPSGEEQRMLKITRVNAEEFVQEDHGGCAFVPFLPGLAE